MHHHLKNAYGRKQYSTIFAKQEEELHKMLKLIVEKGNRMRVIKTDEYHRKSRRPY